MVWWTACLGHAQPSEVRSTINIFLLFLFCFTNKKSLNDRKNHEKLFQEFIDRFSLFQIHVFCVSIPFQVFLIFNLIRIDFFNIFYFYSSYLGKKSPRFITYKKRSKRSAKFWKVLQDCFDRFAVVFYKWVSGGFSSTRPRWRSWGMGQAQLTRNVMQCISEPPPCVQRDLDCEPSVTRAYHVYRVDTSANTLTEDPDIRTWSFRSVLSGYPNYPGIRIIRISVLSVLFGYPNYPGIRIIRISELSGYLYYSDIRIIRIRISVYYEITDCI